MCVCVGGMVDDPEFFSCFVFRLLFFYVFSQQSQYVILHCENFVCVSGNFDFDFPRKNCGFFLRLPTNQPFRSITVTGFDSILLMIAFNIIIQTN